MRKGFILLLSCLLLFSLAACGGSGKTETTTEEGILSREEETEDVGILSREEDEGDEGILSREEDEEDVGILSREDETTQEEQAESMVSDESGEGASSTGMYNKNTISEEELAMLEEDAKENGYEIEWDENGDLIIVEDGSKTSLSANWPENEFTKGLPIPPSTVLISAHEESEDECTLVVTWTLEDVTAYVEQLKEAGFTKEVEEQNMPSMDIYMYSASNGKVTVSAMLASGTGAIMIKK